MDAEQVAGALARLLPAFEADGLALSVERADPEAVVISLRQTAAACERCVWSQEALEAMIGECLRESGITPRRVEVVTP